MNEDTQPADASSNGESKMDPTAGRLSRRATLGMLGAGALGLAAGGSVSAGTSGDGFEVRGDEPNPMALVDSKGEELSEYPDENMEIFDAEPEFPPYVNYDEMVEEFGEKAEEYLEPHGAPTLLDSRRLVVNPKGEPATWGDFSGGSAAATVESDGDGSHVEIEFDGLASDGVYTVWVVHEPGWHRPLGGNGGENNVFHSERDGTATVSVVDYPDELTLPPGATEDEGGETVPNTEYPLHEIEGEFFFIVAYHYDNRVWGSQPGPYWVPKLVINQFDH
jgi:hypothetical protein